MNVKRFVGRSVREAMGLVRAAWGEEAVVKAITNGFSNQMPSQATKLNADQIHVLTAYVWGLSNGVQTAEAKTAEVSAK